MTDEGAGGDRNGGRAPGRSQNQGQGQEQAAGGSASGAEDAAPVPGAKRRQRKQVLLRLDPAMHDALARWAADELRSTNAQIDYVLRQALKNAGRLPGDTRPHPRRGRPPREE